MRTCPIDSESLAEVMVGNVAVDVCSVCGGKWFDGGELNLVVKQGLPVLAQLDLDHPNTTGKSVPPGGKACPRCGERLVPFSFKHAPGVVLEGCRKCKGIWADHGKLTQLALKLGLPQEKIPQPKPSAAAPAPPSEITCPECGAKNKPSDVKCWQCDASLVPEAPQCPRCREPLAETERDGIDLLVCESCGGVWLNEESLMQMFASHMDKTGNLDTSPQRRDEDLAARSEPAACPNCRTGMLEHDFIAQLDGMYNVPTNVRADRCTTCNGMWFDVGELTAVQRAVEEYRASKEDDAPAFGVLGGE